MQPRFRDDASLAGEHTAWVVPFCPLGLGLMIHAVSQASFAPVAALVFPWLQERVTALDAGALVLLSAFDEAVLAYAVEALGVRDLVDGEIFSLDVARLPAPYNALGGVAPCE